MWPTVALTIPICAGYGMAWRYEEMATGDGYMR